MHADYNQYEVEGENMGAALNYIESAVKGDTSDGVMKPAKINTGFTLPVPLFVATGDKIEIDIRTAE